LTGSQGPKKQSSLQPIRLSQHLIRARRHDRSHPIHAISLNWGLAAALGVMLLAVVLVLYFIYDKIVGIDNMKLG